MLRKYCLFVLSLCCCAGLVSAQTVDFDYSTYLGGSANETIFGIGVDDAGNMLVGGRTRSTNFPVTNALQAAHANPASEDSFVSKFSPDGQTLLYSTYFGGTSWDYGYGFAVHKSSGHAYLVGSTLSTDLQMTNSYQSVNAGGKDLFVAKFNTNGQLLFSTYLGGSGDEDVDAEGVTCAVDSDGNLFICGYTDSTNFPVTNALYNANAGGQDVIALKLLADGSDFVYATYLGGSSNDMGRGVAVDQNGYASFVGSVTSTNYPITNAYQSTRTIYTNEDAFVTRLSPSGQNIEFSTYLGGSNIDFACSAAADAAGNVYVIGQTASDLFPVTAGAYQTNLVRSASDDVWVSKFSPSGALDYSTFLGGYDSDYGYAIVVDAAGSAHIAGVTKSAISTLYPVTNAVSTNWPGGAQCAFVSKLNPDGSDLVYSTLLGGSDSDLAYSIAFGDANCLLVGGETTSTNYPLVDAYQTNLVGVGECTVTRVMFDENVFELHGTNGAIIMNGELASTNEGTAFGVVVTSATNYFTITNKGSIALSISAVTTSGTDVTSFDVIGVPTNIPARGAAVFSIICDPFGGGAKTATVTFTNDSIVPVFVMDLTGEAPGPGGGIVLATNLLTYVTTYGGAVSTQAVQLRNAGGTDFEYTNSQSYSSGASNWLTVTPDTDVMYPAGFTNLLNVADVTGIDAGTYCATNIVIALDSTNSPQMYVCELTINKADQTIWFLDPGQQETTNAVTLMATNSAGLPITFTVGSGLGSIAGGSNLTFTGSGVVSIVASQPGTVNYNVAPEVTNTFTVTKAVASVTLFDLNQTFNETARVVTNTTLPAGLTVDTSYDGTASLPTNVGTYVVTGTVNEVMYQGASTGTLVVVRADQTISFANPGAQETTNNVVLAATGGNSTNPVNFVVSSGPGSIAGGSNLTFTAAGTVSIVASQVGNSNYNPAPSITNSFSVTKAVAEVTLFDLAQTFDRTLRVVTNVTVPVGMTVDTTYDGSATAPTNAGTYSVTGMVNEIMYQGSGTGLLVVAQADQTIDSASPGDQLASNSVVLAGTASSTLPVSFAVGSGPGSIASGSNLTFTGSGVVSIVISQAGDGNFNAAPEVTNTFNVTKADQIIAFPNPGAQETTNVVVLAATTTSGLAASFFVDSGLAAIASGSNLLFLGAGEVTVVAYQSGDAIYNAAVNVSNTFTVTKAVAPVTLFDFAQVYDGTSRVVTNLTVPRDLAVDMTYNALTALPTNAGVYAVTGVVDNVMYQGTGTGTLVVAKADQTITFPNPGAQETTNAVTLAATASSTFSVSFAVDAGPGSIAGGSNLTFTASGVVSVVASQAGDSNFNPASPEVTNSLVVTKAIAGVAVGSVNATYDGSPHPAFASTVPEGLTVDLTYNGSATVPSDAGTYSVTGVVNDVMYQGSDTNSVVIGQAAQTITFPGPGPQKVTNVVKLAATGGNSGSPISFAVVSGPGQITGGTNLSFTAAGAVIVTADQTGDGNYIAAATVSNIVAVSVLAPAISAPSAVNIWTTTADLGGEVTDTNEAPVLERGIYWSLTDGFADGTGTKVSETGSFGNGTFSLAVTGLTPGVSNYFKAFAVNWGGTTYSLQAAVLTEPLPWPADGLVLTERRPKFRWVEVAGAEWYRLYIARDGVKFFDKWVDKATWTSPGDMKGGDYQWWTKPWSAATGEGDWSTGNAFTMQFGIPGAVVPLYPSGAVETNRPMFAWTNVASADWYQLYVEQFGVRVYNEWIAATNRIPTSDLPFGSYEWWVRTWSADGYGPWSTSQTYTYGIPVLVAPEGVLSNRSPELTWMIMPGTVGTDIWLSKNGVFYLLKKNSVGTNWTVNTTLPYGTYGWWARGLDQDGRSGWSVGKQFDIGVPLSIAPVGTLAGTPVELRWDDTRSHEAQWYKVWIHRGGVDYTTFWVLKADTTNIGGGERTWTADFVFPAGSYTWWIRANDGTSHSRWSDTTSFTVP